MPGPFAYVSLRRPLPEGCPGKGRIAYRCVPVGRRRAVLEAACAIGGQHMDAAEPVYAERRRIESHDVDLRGRIKPHVLLSRLLNTAWNHTHGTSAGYESLVSRGLMWVLIGIRIKICRLAEWGDRVELRTWGRQVGRLYAMRDFTLGTESGDPCVVASSSWMVLDAESGRPRRLEGLMDDFPWLPGRGVLESDPEKVPALEGGSRLACLPVLFSDIDVNGHVNSACYLRWMLDAHSHGFLEAHEPGMIELSFLSEALPEEEVAVFSDGGNDTENCAVRRSSDGRDLCRCRTAWREAWSPA